MMVILLGKILRVMVKSTVVVLKIGFYILIAPHFIVIAYGDAVDPNALPPLYDLETMLCESSEVLSSLAALNESSYLLESEKQKMGPKLYFGATYGYNDEPITETSDEKINYEKLTLKTWVSFPILGTWNIEKINALRAELRKLEGEALYKKTVEANLTSLRKAYIVVWSENRRERLINAFLEDEANAERLLKARVQKGLLLEANRLELVSNFKVAHRDLRDVGLKRSQAMGVIRLATSKNWSNYASCPAPTLPGPIGDTKVLYLNIEKLADQYYRERSLKLKEEIAKLSGKLNQGGNIDIGVAAGRDFPGSTGSGVYVSATIVNPFSSIGSENDPQRLAAEEAVKKERQEEISSRMKMEEELTGILRLREYALESMKANEERIKAATEAVRENGLRYEKLPGGAFELLVKSRYDYMRSALDLIDAQSLFLQTEAELAVYSCPPGLNATESKPSRYFPLTGIASAEDPDLSVNQTPDIPLQCNLSAYIWDASPLLNPLTRREELDKFVSEGFSRMLLSLNAEQIKYIKTQEGKEALTDVLAQCLQRGIAVDALLGEPLWLQEEHRRDLTDIIRLLGEFPFRGIHLDIEPDSLPNAEFRRQELANDLIETVREAKKCTDKPISLSIHPRYLEGNIGDLVSKGLSEAGIEYVAVMIYSSNSQRTTERFEPIMKCYPHLRLGLSQSVESTLSNAESYASAGKRAFKEVILAINSKLCRSQFAGIFVQSWEEYKEMKL